MNKYRELQTSIATAETILVIQAENPDGDSLASALAIEELLGEQSKNVIMYCPVDMPKYLRYLNGWDRVTNEWTPHFDVTIIVDTASDTLLSKVLVPEQLADIKRSKVFVIDHHDVIEVAPLPFEHTPIVEPLASTGELLFKIARELEWPISVAAADNLLSSIYSDTLGMTTPSVSAETFATASELTKSGASIARIEALRREFMLKSPRILRYKGELIQRLEYHLDGRLAMIHIPWEEITKYSDEYNPSMLVMNEALLVTDVQVALAIKTYPDGKVTGKLRCASNAPIANTIAQYFGGDGHPYSAGFRTYEEYSTLKPEIIHAVSKTLEDYHA